MECLIQGLLNVRDVGEIGQTQGKKTDAAVENEQLLSCIECREDGISIQNLGPRFDGSDNREFEIPERSVKTL